jgi:hypothetical protein
MRTTNNETDFKKTIDQGVNTIVRRNDQSHIRNDFIDHELRTV